MRSAKIRARAAGQQAASNCKRTDAVYDTENGVRWSNFAVLSTAAYKRHEKRFGLALLTLAQNTLDYGLMMAIMTYNGYVFLTIVLSMGVGHLLFGQDALNIELETVRRQIVMARSTIRAQGKYLAQRCIGVCV